MSRVQEYLKTAESLLKKYKLDKWNCAVSHNARSWLAKCYYGNKQIVLSKYLLELGSNEEVMDTILHEVAHAIVGPDVEHHGKEWLAKSKELGCSGNLAGHRIAPYLYEAKCSKCNSEFGLDKLRKNKTYFCQPCADRENGGEYDSRFEIFYEKKENL